MDDLFDQLFTHSEPHKFTFDDENYGSIHDQDCEVNKSLLQGEGTEDSKESITIEDNVDEDSHVICIEDDADNVSSRVKRKRTNSRRSSRRHKESCDPIFASLDNKIQELEEDNVNDSLCSVVSDEQSFHLNSSISRKKARKAIQSSTGIADESKQAETIYVIVRGSIKKFPFHENLPLSALILDVCTRENVLFNSVTLCHDGKPLDSTLLPSQVSINYSTILDCIIFSSSSQPCEVTRKRNPDCVAAKLQDGSKRSSLYLLHKAEKMSVAFNAYLKEHNLSSSQVSFKFDGEPITFDQTPAELEADDEICIDVIFTS